MQVAEQPHPVSYKDPSNELDGHMLRVSRTIMRTRLMSRGAAPMGDHRLHKRVMLGEQKNARRRGPWGKEKE